MASAATLTSDEAIALIELASAPEQLFGTGDKQAYRRLARLVHPDANPGVGNQRAARAFAKLSTLWQQHREGGGALVASGDIASVTRLPAHGIAPRSVLSSAATPRTAT